MDGLLLIDKPEGPTSHDVVDRIRRITGLRAVGHAGTLDPFASGLLLLGLGKATKRLNEFVGSEKEYDTTLTLGSVSDTYDRMGEIVVVASTHIPDRTKIIETLNTFQPGYEQKAPIYSAKKIQGKKLYELARAGEATEEMRPSKYVELSELCLLEYTWPHLSLRVHCSSGTYIRSLGHDIGQALGTGGYLQTLRRTKIGTLLVSNALPLHDLNVELIRSRLF
jgi:tRNA pseudouridine55 synthase